MARIPLPEFYPLTWAVFWRFTLLSIPVGFVAGFVASFIVGFIWGVLGYLDADNAEASSRIFGIIGNIAAIVASFFVLALVLRSMVGKKIGGFILLPLSQIVREEDTAPIVSTSPITT